MNQILVLMIVIDAPLFYCWSRSGSICDLNLIVSRKVWLIVGTHLNIILSSLSLQSRGHLFLNLNLCYELLDCIKDLITIGSTCNKVFYWNYDQNDLLHPSAINFLKRPFLQESYTRQSWQNLIALIHIS